MLNIEGIAARHGSLGPRALDALSPAVRRLVDEDLPALLRVARAAAALMGDENIGKTVDLDHLEPDETFLIDACKNKAISVIVNVDALTALMRALSPGSLSLVPDPTELLR